MAPPESPAGRTSAVLPPPIPPAGALGPDGQRQPSATGSKSGLFDSTKGVLKQIKKYEAEVGLAYEEVPVELAEGRELDLREWSLIANDNTLVNVADCTHRRVERRAEELLAELRATMDFRVRSTVASAKKSAVEQAGTDVGTMELKLHGAAGIGDLGLRAIGEHCSMLRVLDIGGAFRVSDVGLRCVGVTCRNITELNISACLGVTGVGLAVFGDCAPRLQKLTLSRCHQLAGWAFQRVVTGCRELEDVDISHCDKLTDHDVLVMASHCPRLRRVNLRDAKQISDSGLVELGKCCDAIEWLDLSRTDMSWKITDMGILGIAEGCPLLKTLIAQHCEQISDVACAWLGRGCRTLTHLDLRNCTKVSNGGIRALAEGCFELKFLDLTNMKCVTDIGVKSLANNCKSLTHLNASGMYMLTDGKKRDFGLEGIQAMAKDLSCLSFLHLVGCFQISKGALKCLADSPCCPVFKDLSFAGCQRLDESLFCRLAASAGKLQKLSLAGCGSCVSDKMLETLAKNNHNLRRLDVSECERVGSGTTHALLRHCKHLVSLNFSGCPRVDDMAVLPFSEATDLRPGLEELFLVGCTGVGDTGMSWLADGLAHCVVLLSLKGTKVTSTALHSVRDRFRYSELRRNPAFLGFYPLRRWKHRRLINDYGERYRAASKMQATFRAMLGRRRAREAKKIFLGRWCALRLQSLWRGARARELVRLIRWERDRNDRAARCLQGFAHIISAKEELKRLRETYTERLEHRSALHIQTVFRGMIARRLVASIRKARSHQQRRLENGVRLAQRVFRGFQGRIRYARLYRERQEFIKKRERCAVTLQRWWRGTWARTLIARKKTAMAREKYQRKISAIKIQNRYRTYRCRLIIAERRKAKEGRIWAATKIQSHYRAMVARSYLSFQRMLWEQASEEAAVLVLQCAARCRQARDRVQRQRTVYNERSVQLSKKALTIQRYVRGHQARKRVVQLRREREELEQRMLELQHWGAIKIQSVTRGRWGRRTAAQKLLEHKGKWKEMWDQDKHRPFYYNQVTGEIRWRKPQALLDLMRRPTCHNCEFYEAAVECQACMEFYCTACWEQVHYNGKRKRHKFRSLYDFYDKRVDYGDAEFPSRWPTEVEQDEMAGWQLRIGENFDRLADDEHGDWQRYNDEKSGRSFYYNARTMEGSYDEPPEWRAQIEADKVAAEDTASSVFGAQTVVEDESHVHPELSFSIGQTTWSKFLESETGVPYYVNNISGESTYEAPPELANAPYSLWTKHYDAEYQVDYFYNQETGEATYDRPADFVEVQPY